MTLPKNPKGIAFPFCRQLLIGVDPSDDNYMPYRVIVNGISDSGNVVQLKETCIDV